MADHYPPAMSGLTADQTRQIDEALTPIIGGQDWVLITRERPGKNTKAWIAWQMPAPADLPDEDITVKQRLIQTISFAMTALHNYALSDFKR